MAQVETQIQSLEETTDISTNDAKNSNQTKLENSPIKKDKQRIDTVMILTEGNLDLLDSDHEDTLTDGESDRIGFSSSTHSQYNTETKTTEDSTRKTHSVTIAPLRNKAFNTNRLVPAANHYNQGMFNKPDLFQEIVNYASPVTNLPAFEDGKRSENDDPDSKHRASIASQTRGNSMYRRISNFGHKNDESTDERAKTNCVKCILQ